MWDKCETEYITYEWDSLCELGKKRRGKIAANREPGQVKHLPVGNCKWIKVFANRKKRDSAHFQAVGSSYNKVPSNSVHSV